jgi:uncharacterized protein YbaR (Trm112 family)
MIGQELLDILVCPETKQSLRLVSEENVDKINREIGEGRLLNRGGKLVSEKIDAGLLREDGSLVYPIRHDIPIMLIDEAICVSL